MKTEIVYIFPTGETMNQQHHVMPWGGRQVGGNQGESKYFELT
jgi:hypothetical protein